MKPLDDHLRDASSSWMHELRPTMVESAAKIAPSVAKSAFPTGFIVGGLSSIAVVATVWWAVSGQQGSTPEPVPVSPTEQVERVVNSTPAAAEPTIQNGPAVSMDPPAVVEREYVEAQTAKPQTADGFSSDGSSSGFMLEVERILARAQAFEKDQPMRAATEYIGLAKLCLARHQVAHATSALHNAEELCQEGGYDHLMPEVRRLQEAAQRQIKP